MMTLRFFNENLKLEGEVRIPNNFENFIMDQGSIINEKFISCDYALIKGADYETAQKIIFLLRNNTTRSYKPLPKIKEIREVVNKETIWSRTMAEDEETSEWLIFSPYRTRGYSINYNIYDLI